MIEMGIPRLVWYVLIVDEQIIDVQRFIDKPEPVDFCYDSIPRTYSDIAHGDSVTVVKLEELFEVSSEQVKECDAPQA